MMEIEIENFVIFADSVFVEFMQDNIYQRKDIPIYGDFENFCVSEGYLESDIFDGEKRDIDTQTVTFDQFVKHQLGRFHIHSYLQKLSTFA